MLTTRSRLVWAAAGAIAAHAAATTRSRIGWRMGGGSDGGRGQAFGPASEGLAAGTRQLSVGKPSSFHAFKPPARCASYGRPAACAISEAVADRFPGRPGDTTPAPPRSGHEARSEPRQPERERLSEAL